jgi:hypothetical protein
MASFAMQLQSSLCSSRWRSSREEREGSSANLFAGEEFDTVRGAILSVRLGAGPRQRSIRYSIQSHSMP